jgi:histidine ammonia-lyase
MSATAARHLRDVLANTRRIVAMEVLCAAQALDLADAVDRCPAVGAAHAAVRTVVPLLVNDDLVVADPVSAVEALVATGDISRAASAGEPHVPAV